MKKNGINWSKNIENERTNLVFVWYVLKYKIRKINLDGRRNFKSIFHSPNSPVFNARLYNQLIPVQIISIKLNGNLFVSYYYY